MKIKSVNGNDVKLEITDGKTVELVRNVVEGYQIALGDIAHNLRNHANCAESAEPEADIDFIKRNLIRALATSKNQQYYRSAIDDMHKMFIDAGFTIEPGIDVPTFVQASIESLLHEREVNAPAAKEIPSPTRQPTPVIPAPMKVTLTPKADHSYHGYLNAGWTDHQLVEIGYATWNFPQLAEPEPNRSTIMFPESDLDEREQLTSVTINQQQWFKADDVTRCFIAWGATEDDENVIISDLRKHLQVGFEQPVDYVLALTRDRLVELMKTLDEMVTNEVKLNECLISIGLPRPGDAVTIPYVIELLESMNKRLETATDDQKPVTDLIVEFLTNSGRPVNKPHNLTYVVNELIAFTKVTLNKLDRDHDLAKCDSNDKGFNDHLKLYTPSKVSGVMNQWFYPIQEADGLIRSLVRQLRKVNRDNDRLRTEHKQWQQALSSACREFNIDVSLSDADMIDLLHRRLKSAENSLAQFNELNLQPGTVIQSENMVMESAADQWCKIYKTVHSSAGGTVNNAVEAAHDFIESINL
ncbi:coil containing protein [Vibrio phage 1.049.O._10N.286.54.B5]|nr:coil containing protein [Vibrio phage 1.049.O._10N.286.54.B5]AUR84218.1 coil containing protein [Vibrio phage 1.050.O._10N.286.48.A6]